MSAYVTKSNLKKKTDEWLMAVSGFNYHEMELNVDASALIIVDMQNFFIDKKGGGYTEGGPPIVPNLAKLADTFRSAKRPVIYTAHGHHPSGTDYGILHWWWGDGLLEGSGEAKIIDELKPKKNERVIKKHRYSAFYDSDLETILRCMGIEDLVIGGVMTNLCCESTARDAYFRDYRVFFPADASGAICEEMHLSSLLNLAYGFAYIPRTQEILDTFG